MEPRPPKRPKSTIPSTPAGALYPGPRQWEQTVPGGAASGYETSTYGPVTGSEEAHGGVEFPIVPKSQRGHRWLGPLLAALLLAGLVGGGAWLVTKFLDGDEKRDDVAQVTTAVTPTPIPPVTTPALTAPAVTIPTEEPSQDVAEPPATTEPENTVETAAPVATEPPAVPAEEEPSGATRYIPSAEEVGADFAATDQGGERTEADVAVAVGPDGVTLLDQWGWQENQFQEFAIQADVVDPNATSFISVSVHRFETEEGAAAALTGLSDVVIATQGLQEVEPPKIGDQARALTGTGDGVNLYVLYVRDGRYVLRLGGASNTGDPAAVVNALAGDLVS